MALGVCVVLGEVMMRRVDEVEEKRRI